MKKNLIITVVAVLVAAGISFYGGAKYAASKSPVNAADGSKRAISQGQFNRSGQTANGVRGGFTNGEILKLDENSLTLKLNDGGSKIIYFASSTNISKMSDGTRADLEAGKMIMVSGTDNSDKSLTAQSIQIRPNSLPIGNPGNQDGPGGMFDPGARDSSSTVEQK